MQRILLRGLIFDILQNLKQKLRVGSSKISFSHINSITLRKTFHTMKRNYTYAFMIGALLIFASVLTSCTGFSEGPDISLRSAKKKMAKTWRVKEAVKFNVEITNLYKDGYFIFTEDGDFSTVDTKREVNLPPFTQTSTVTVLGAGDWRCITKTRFETLYTFTFKDPYNSNITYSEEAYEQWDITRLNSKEFWIQNDSMSFKLMQE